MGGYRLAWCPQEQVLVALIHAKTSCDHTVEIAMRKPVRLVEKALVPHQAYLRVCPRYVFEQKFDGCCGWGVVLVVDGVSVGCTGSA